MRYLVLVLALVLVACSSQTGSCSNEPTGSACDSVPDDVTPITQPSDGPRDVGPEFAVQRDAAIDAVIVEDTPEDVVTLDVAPDVQVDVAADVAAVVDVPADTSSDTPEASAPRDVAVVDVPRGECAAVERSCRVNADCAMCTPVRGLTWCCGVIGGRSTCAVPLGDGSCPGVVRDAGPAFPDVRISCTVSYRPCTTDEQCQSMCVPLTDGRDWCCGRLNGVCGTTQSGSCMR